MRVSEIERRHDDEEQMRQLREFNRRKMDKNEELSATMAALMGFITVLAIGVILFTL